MKKKVLAVILSILVVALMMPGSAFADEIDEQSKITIIYTGDIQGGVMDNITLAGIVSYAKEQKDLSDYVEIVDAGNAFSGTTLTATSEGQFAVDCMNIAGYGIFVPGENDICYGRRQLSELSSSSQFNYISCNYHEIANCDSYLIKKYGTKKVGYVGITNPVILDEYDKNDASFFYETVQNAVDAALASGADYIVAVGNLSENSEKIYSAQSTIQNTCGINAFINTGADKVISGNEIRTAEGKPCLLTSPGADLSSFGVMKINGTGIETQLISSYKYRDINTKDSIEEIASYYGEALSQTFATTGYQLSAANASGIRIIESQETNLGDLIADAYRTITEADVAFVEANEIKSNIQAGQITYNDILSVVNGNKNISVKKLSGYELLNVLEMSARLYPNRNDNFLQLSGVTFDIQETIVSTVNINNSGEFVSVDGDYRVTNIKINGEPLDMMKTYKVAASNDTLSGSTGYTMFKEGELFRQNVVTDSQAIVNYITNVLKGTIPSAYQKSQARIDSIKLARQSEIDEEIERLADEKLAEEYQYTASLKQKIADLQEIIAIKDLSLKATASFKKSGSSRKITVKVTPSKKIEGVGYQYYRSTKSSSGYTKKKSKTGLSYTNTSVSKGKTYYYKVRAYKYIDGKYYYSEWSNKVSCKVKK